MLSCVVASLLARGLRMLSPLENARRCVKSEDTSLSNDRFRLSVGAVVCPPVCPTAAFGQQVRSAMPKSSFGQPRAGFTFRSIRIRWNLISHPARMWSASAPLKALGNNPA